MAGNRDLKSLADLPLVTIAGLLLKARATSILLTLLLVSDSLRILKLLLLLLHEELLLLLVTPLLMVQIHNF